MPHYIRKLSDMKKITLLLLLPFAAVLSVWSQSTFTIFPKFQVGDTLVYDAVDNTNAAVQKAMPNSTLSRRRFYLIVKEKDNKGNLKIDYQISEIKINEKDNTDKAICFVNGAEKFLENDLKNKAIRFTIDSSGRFQSLDNKDEIAELYLQRIWLDVLELVKKQTKHKPTAKEIAEAKEKIKAQLNILDVFEEIPALLKYYGQPLMEGKSENVDSVTTKYTVARLDDGTIWLKTNIDLLNGDETVAKDNPGEEFLKDSNSEEDDDDDMDLGITATSEEEYKYNTEGIVTYLKETVQLANKYESSESSTLQGGITVRLIEIKKRR